MKKAASNSQILQQARHDVQAGRLERISPLTRSAGIIAILLIVVFATFQGVRENEFAGFDDPLTLYRNPRLHPAPPESVFHSTLWYWNHSEYSLYIPVTYEFWAGLTEFAHLDKPGPSHIDLDAGVFHTANLCLHLLNVIVVFLLLRLLVQRDWAAGIGALAYGLHPFQVEPIAWASGLKDVLSGLWVMLALWQYLLYASAQREGFAAWRFRRPLIHYALALLFLVLAMLSKPSAMMVPFIAGILDWLVVGRPLRRVATGVIPMFLVESPLVVVAKLVQTGSPIDVVAFWQRPFIATDALAFYLYKLVAPIHLAACYARRPAVVIQHGWLWWTWIAPTAVVGALFRFGRNRRWLIASAGVMLAALAPVLGLTAFDYQRISTVADHYMYVAMLGPALALAFALTLARPRWLRRIALTVTTLALLFFAGMSAVQMTYWQDGLSLWSHAVAVAPESHTAHLNLGKIYDDAGKDALPLAYVEFAKAVELNPNDFNGQDDLASALVRLGRAEEAMQHAKLAIELQDRTGVDPTAANHQGQFKDRVDLAKAFLNRNRPKDAADMYESALRIEPDSPEAIRGLENARSQMAAARPGGPPR